jgi:hypothetical protein
VNFHRSNLLTESDKRKYKELFSKLISNEAPSIGLPILSGIQSKVKVIKGPTMNQYPINIPTNLNALIAQDQASNQNDVTSSNLPPEPSANPSASHNNSSWVHEVPITFRAQLPSLTHASRNTKANLARQVTNVIKRNTGLITDKII